MRLVSKKKCMEKIRKQIDIQKDSVLHDNIDKQNAFEIFYRMMQLSKELCILDKKELDILWREAQEIIE